MSSERHTVLLVDDSALLRTVLRDVIAGMPEFEVIGTASNGREAIEAVRALAPDVVTLDVEMPGMDGLETLARIMRDSPRPVVMLSDADTSGGVDLTLRALDLGAVEFVRKGAVTAAEPMPSSSAATEEAWQSRVQWSTLLVPKPARTSFWKR